MRQAHLLALPLLTLTLSAFAQQGKPAEKPDPVPDNQPFVLRTEEPPAAQPDRLVLNRSKAEFRIWYEALKQSTTEASPAGAPASTTVAPPAKVEAGGNGGFSLTQTGVPVRAGAQAAAASAVSGPAAPAATNVAPPAPVPQTMAQAAQALPQASAPVVSAPAAAPEAAPVAATAPRAAPIAESVKPLDKVKALVLAYRKEAVMGGAAVLLLILVGLRLVRRRGSDDSAE